MNIPYLQRLSVLALLFLVGCSSTGPIRDGKGVTICDSYVIFDMCVRDLTGDNTVDMVYFSDTNEIFMYQAGRKDLVGEVMAFHQCAVPLNEGMQATTNRILDRENLSLSEEIAITKGLVSNYMAAKPRIDACNASFAEQEAAPAPQDDTFGDDTDWE